jgi:hypothetical protein
MAAMRAERTPPDYRPKTWEELFALLGTIAVPDDFMADRPMNELPLERDVFRNHD